MANRILLLLAIASRNDPTVPAKVISEIAGMTVNPVQSVVPSCIKLASLFSIFVHTKL